MLNPWAILAALVAIGSLVGVVGWKSYEAGQNSVIAAQTKADEVEKRTREAALAAAAEAIAGIEVRNVTIRQRAETVTREVPVYRDCRHDGDGLRAINEALEAPGARPAGDTELPAAGRPRG